ncbi:MAG: alpha/beta hydrolase [Pseudonocardiaceae bacterium]
MAPDELRTVSADIEATADAAARTVDEFDGQQGVRDASVFDKDASKWRELARGLADRGNEVETAAKRLDAWSGAAADAAADAAKAEFAAHRKRYADMADTISKIPAVFTDLAAQIRALQPKLGEIVSEAQSFGCQVHHDGTVSYEPDIVRHLPLGQEDLGPPAAQICQDRIADLVRQAQNADAHATAALNGLSAQATGFAPAANDTTVAAIPGRGTAPAEVKKWWDGLSPMQQESLLFTHPDQLGQLDGLPSVIRDRANRSRMAGQKGRLQADKERLDLLGDARTPEQSAQLDAINNSLGGIGTIEKRLYYAEPGQQPAFLLGFDSSGTGRAIVAMGNPDAATNVATYVPGTTASLGGVNSDLQRSDSMVKAAHNAGSPSTSAITWLGYDAPQNIFFDAAENRWADGAKQDLDRFQDGLRAAHEGARAHNTVIGHSYGTTVIGHAARDGDLNADDVVFVASPGVGVTHADQLHLNGVPSDQVGQHVHSTVAQCDPIKLAAGVNGPSPTGLAFGGTTFESNPGEAGPWYELGWNKAVHSQYWDDGNQALVNMGRIIAGKPTH